jgi:hypothetical protein
MYGVFASNGDTLYGWTQGKLKVMKGSGSVYEDTPSGLTPTPMSDLVVGAVSPDGARIAIIARTANDAYKLLRISNATSGAPTVAEMDVPKAVDVWTSGSILSAR